MACSECSRLRAERDRLEKVHAAAIQALCGGVGAGAGPLPGSEYVRLKIAADDARLDLEVARLEFEQHERSHSTTAKLAS